MLAAATILGALPVAAAPAGERVSFESSAPDPATGKPVTVQGLLFRPAAAAAPDPRRRPAIVALHGCGGMYSAVKSRRDALSARHQAMAELLVAEGYVVLFPDSFRSRGVEEICTIEARARRINGTHRRQDAQAALAWLQRRDDVLADRIAVLGWSHGGSAVLAALDGRAPSVAAWRDRSPQARLLSRRRRVLPGVRRARQGATRLHAGRAAHPVRRRQRRLDRAGTLHRYRRAPGRCRRAGGDHRLSRGPSRLRRAVVAAAVATRRSQRRQPRPGGDRGDRPCGPRRRL
ncbi:MAG: dienelactone hydrolase family protein [Betaproteobacteria bacterium]|nr:dienelactone hydrolase family protein [Betaproteobacteria bacterium]